MCNIAGYVGGQRAAPLLLDMPSEIVGLFITVDRPDRVVGARWNLPACAARDDQGTYIASTPKAFPGPPAWRT